MTHSKKELLDCSLCGKQFISEFYLNAHIKSHTNVEHFGCPRCGHTFPTKAALNSHMLTHDSEKKYECLQCEKSFTGKLDLNIHVKEDHSDDNRLSCDLCDQKFRLKSHLKIHLKMHAFEKFVSSRCNGGVIDSFEKAFNYYWQCRELFAWESFLNSPEETKSHGEKTTIGEEKSEISSEGDDSLDPENLLKAHVIIQSGENAVAYSRCGSQFAIDSCLSSREKICVDESPVESAECEESSFDPEILLKTHVITNPHLNKFSCLRIIKQIVTGSFFSCREKIQSEEPSGGSSELAKTSVTTDSNESMFGNSQCEQKFASGLFSSCFKKIRSSEDTVISSRCGGNYETVKAPAVTNSSESVYGNSQCEEKFISKSTKNSRKKTYSNEKLVISQCGNSYEAGVILFPIITDSSENILSYSQFGEQFALKSSATNDEDIHSKQRLVIPSDCETIFNAEMFLKIPATVDSNENTASYSQFGEQLALKSSVSNNEDTHSEQILVIPSECETTFNPEMFLKFPAVADQNYSQFGEQLELKSSEDTQTEWRVVIPSEHETTFNPGIFLEIPATADPNETMLDYSQFGEQFLLTSSVNNDGNILSERRLVFPSECETTLNPEMFLRIPTIADSSENMLSYSQFGEQFALKSSISSNEETQPEWRLVIPSEHETTFNPGMFLKIPATADSNKNTVNYSQFGEQSTLKSSVRSRRKTRSKRRSVVPSERGTTFQPEMLLKIPEITNSKKNMVSYSKYGKQRALESFSNSFEKTNSYENSVISSRCKISAEPETNVKTILVTISRSNAFICSQSSRDLTSESLRSHVTTYSNENPAIPSQLKTNPFGYSQRRRDSTLKNLGRHASARCNKKHVIPSRFQTSFKPEVLLKTSVIADSGENTFANEKPAFPSQFKTSLEPEVHLKTGVITNSRENTGNFSPNRYRLTLESISSECEKICSDEKNVVSSQSEKSSDSEPPVKTILVTISKSALAYSQRGNEFASGSSWSSNSMAHSNENPVMFPQGGPSFKPKVLVTPVITSSQENALGYSECEESNTSESRLTSLEESPSNVEESFGCFHCGQSFMQKSSLNAHVLTHFQEKQFSCVNCKESFDCEANLIDHMKIDCDKTPVTSTQYGSKLEMLLRGRGITDSRGNTSDFFQYGKEFSPGSYLSNHEKNLIADGPFNCPACGRSFKQKSYLDAHIITHSAPYSCPYCGCSFLRKAGLSVHMKSHFNEARVKSSQYPKKTKDFNKGSFDLKSSQYPKKTNDFNKGTFDCSVCGKSFLLRSHLCDHILSHVYEKFDCTQCGKSFSTKSYLEHHMKIHSNNRPYESLQCEKPIPPKSFSHIHSKIRNYENPFSCSICQESFPRISLLDEHIEKTHNSDEELFACPECDMEFAERSNVIDHMRTHLTDGMTHRFLVPS